MEVQNPALVKCEPINFLEYVQSSEYVFSGRKQRPGEKGRDGTWVMGGRETILCVIVMVD